MDVDDLATLVADLRTEGSDLPEVEAKRASHGFPKSLAPTLSAFGNTPGGGTIIFGLDEKSGFQSVGVYDAAECKRALASVVRHSIEPPLTFNAVTVEFEGKQLVVAEIDELPAASKPCRVASSKKAYLRSYDGDYQLSALEEQAFLANRSTPRFDISAADGSTAVDLDEDLIRSYVQTCRQSSTALARFTDQEILFKTGVIVQEDRVPSVAGLLALGKYPQQFFPNIVIQASVAPGPDAPPGTRAIDPRKFDGPIPVMLDEALRWISRNTRSRVQFGKDGQGRDEPEYPAEAVRELLSNALVHRDLGPYALGHAITLRLEARQLVLSNPGGLYGVTASELGNTGVSSPRNGHLLRICQNVRIHGSNNRVVEGLASGIPTVLKSVRAAGMVPPRFHDQAVRFSVLVPNHTLLAANDLQWLSRVTAGSLIGDVHRHVLASMRHGQTWTNKTLRTSFPMDSSDARKVLGELVAAGLAEARGERGGRTYRLATSVPKQLEPQQIANSAVLPKFGREILAILVNGACTRLEIQQRAQLSSRQAQRALDQLRGMDLVELEGGRGLKNSTYRLK